MFERFYAVADDARAKLVLTLRLTDFPSTVCQAKRYLTELRATGNLVRAGGDFGEAVAGAAIGTWGRNGRGPAVDGLLSSALHHGKPWRERWDATVLANRISNTGRPDWAVSGRAL